MNIADLEMVLSMAARYGAKVHVNLHLNTTEASMGGAGGGSRPPAKTAYEDAVMEALAGGEPVKKEAIIRAVFGAEYDESQGRAVTRELRRLADDRRVNQPRHGWWQLA